MNDTLTPEVAAKDTLSVAEIASIMDGFKQKQWEKLERSADTLCWGLPIDGMDILSVVIERILEGRRKCPRNIPIEVFIYRAMESRVHAFIKALRRDPIAIGSLSQPGNRDDDGEDVDNDETRRTFDTPEAELIAQQALQQLRALFDEKPLLATILELRMGGDTPGQIQEKLNLTKTQYESAVTAIRRMQEKLSFQES